MFQKIVVAYDGSEHAKKALDKAIGIAKCCGAEIKVVEAVDTSMLVGVGLTPIPQSVIDQLFTKARKDIDEAVSKVKAEGVKVEGVVLEGDPATSVLNYINSSGSDLVVTGTRGLSTLKKVFLGSVSSRIVNESKVTVLIVK